MRRAARRASGSQPSPRLSALAPRKFDEENGETEELLREFTAHVVRVAPIKAPYVLRQNISLVTQLTGRLVRASVRRARGRGIVSNDDLDKIAADALTPALDSGD